MMSDVNNNYQPIDLFLKQEKLAPSNNNDHILGDVPKNLSTIHDPFAVAPLALSPNAVATSADTHLFAPNASTPNPISNFLDDQSLPFKYERKNKNDNSNPIPDNSSLQSLLKDNLGGRLPQSSLARLLEYTTPLPPTIEEPSTTTTEHRQHIPTHQHHSTIIQPRTVPQQQQLPMDNCCIGQTPAYSNAAPVNITPNSYLPSLFSSGHQHVNLSDVNTHAASIDSCCNEPQPYYSNPTEQMVVPSCTGCSDPNCSSNATANPEAWNALAIGPSSSPMGLGYSYNSIMKANKSSKKKEHKEDYIDLTEFLNMPQSEAARRLGIPTSSLSKKWKEVSGDRKWPFRTVCKLDKEISSILDHVTTRPLPPDLEQTLGFLLKKRTQELRPVSIRFKKKDLFA